MAQIARYVSQVPLDTDAGGMPRPNFANPGEALEGLGNAVGNLDAIWQNRKNKQEKKYAFKAENDWQRERLRLTEQLQIKADQMAPDGEGFHDDFVTNVYNPARDKFLASLPNDELREKYTLRLGADGAETAEWSVKAATKERDRTYKWYSDQIASNNELRANAISQYPEEYDKFLKEGMDDFDRSGMPRDQIEQGKRDWEKFAQTAYINKMIEADPEGVLRDLGADPNRLSPTSQLDLLEQAVAGQETGGEANPDTAVSEAGAIGRLQVMPGTARDIAKMLGDEDFPHKGDPTQVAAYLMRPDVNRRYGRTYLQSMLKRYPGDVRAALVAYHSGPGNADKWVKSGYDNAVLGPVGRKYADGVLARLPNAVAGGRKNAVDFANVKLSFVGKRGGAEEDLNPDLVGKLKAAAAAYGVPELKITSGFRDEDTNRSAGGAKNSQHIHRAAVDIDVTNMPHTERIKLIETLSANGITGIGVGSNIIHADVGPRRAWGYANSAGGGAVPKWAEGAINKHLAQTAQVQQGSRATGRFASMSYADRQNAIQRADTAMTQRSTEQNRATAVQKVEVSRLMNNELATLEATGQPTPGFDETRIATVLGEDDFVKYAAKRDVAMRTYTATNDLGTLSPDEMQTRLTEFEPIAGSETFADDEKVYKAIEKKIDKIVKQRAARPDKAALEYPEVKEAHEKMQTELKTGKVEPETVQNFVRLTLERQKEFNVKPGSEAPVPREWGIKIGQALSRVPPPAKGLDVMRASILTQYTELQKVFGEYTDEVIIYSLQQFKGVDKDTAEVIVGYMTQLENGGDPFKLKKRPVEEEMEEPGMWDRLKTSLFGSDDEAAADDAPPNGDLVIRARGYLEGGDPEDEMDAVQKFGQKAVDAAKRQLEGKE